MSAKSRAKRCGLACRFASTEKWAVQSPGWPESAKCRDFTRHKIRSIVREEPSCASRAEDAMAVSIVCGHRANEMEPLHSLHWHLESKPRLTFVRLHIQPAAMGFSDLRSDVEAKP